MVENYFFILTNVGGPPRSIHAIDSCLRLNLITTLNWSVTPKQNHKRYCIVLTSYCIGKNLPLSQTVLTRPHSLIPLAPFSRKISQKSEQSFNWVKRSVFGRQCQTKLHPTSTCFLPTINQRGCQETHIQFPNKSCYLDPCPTFIIKESLDVLPTPITNIINLSLREGVFPNRFKQAIVTPLLKKPTLDKDPFKN